MAITEAVVTALWVMLPAYIPNNVAVLAGGGPPIDGGRTWRGDRLLGDGKTWRGTGVGIAAGAALAAGLNAVLPLELFETVLPAFSTGAAVALPAGAMAGDIAASFLKRRTGRERGAAFPLVDQLDFVVGALALAALVDPGWFGAAFTPTVLGAVIVVTPVLHLGANLAGYALGVKSEPW